MLRGRLDMDILVSVHCCWIMLVNNDLSPTRDLSEHRGQWINQTIEALTITYYGAYVSLEGQ